MEKTEENKMNMDKTMHDKTGNDKTEMDKIEKDKTKKEKTKKGKTEKDNTKKEAKRKRKRKPKVNPTEETKEENVNSSQNEKPTEAKSSMWKTFKFLASVGLILAIVLNPNVFSSGPVAYDTNVMVLTDDNFDQTVSDNPFMLVEFYAPWCGHCQQLAPKYAEVADYFQNANISEVKIAKIDADECTKTAEKYQVDSYPTIKLFKNGDVLDYPYSGQSSEVIIETLKNILSGAAVVQINNEADFERIKEQFTFFVAGYFPDGVNGDYISLAEQTLLFSGGSYFFKINSKLADKLALESGKVALFKQYDEGRIDYQGPLVEANLLKFLTENTSPLLSELNEKTLRLSFNYPKTKHAVIFLSKDSENYEVLTESFKKAAEEMKETEMIFLYADINNDFVKQSAKHFQVDESNLPAFRIFYFENESLKLFKSKSSDFSTESIIKLSKKFLSRKSRENSNEDPVTVLTDENFKEVVFDENKKVFVMFYVPGIELTESILEPIWQELGENYRDEDDIVIAKMDSFANDAEMYIDKSMFVLYQSGKEGKAIGFNVSFLS